MRASKKRLTFSVFCGVVFLRSLENSNATVAIPFVNGFFRALRRGILATFDIGSECGSGNAHGCSRAVFGSGPFLRLANANRKNMRGFTMSQALIFQSTTFDVVDRSGQPWIQSRQLASALGYKDENSVRKIYERNADEFTDAMTATVKMTVGITPVDVRIFSLRGCHLLAMFSRTPVAKAFRVWVLDVLDKLNAERTAPAPDAPLTPDQQCTLKAMVKALVEKGGHYANIWSRFNNHFRIARYCQLPQSRMSEAVDYLMRFEVAPKALPASAPSASESPAELAELPDTRRLFKDIQAAADRLAPCGNWTHLAVRLELGNISTTQAAHAVDLHVNAAWYALGLARTSLLAALAVSKIGR